ncbi:hypothetical protein [Streptomyces sp. NPDC054887]
MVEGDERSRPPGDPAARPGADPPSPKPAPLPQDLPGLLASLGEYLQGHGPDELVVLLRTEIERRELRAYANGWRDAAAEYDLTLRRADQARRLSVVSRTPGRAAVIPFPHDEHDEHDTHDTHDGHAADDPADDATGEAAGAATDGPAPAPSADAADRDAAASRAAPAARRRTRATLVPKSRSSKVPTIPRLRTARPSAREDRDEGRAP